MYMYTSLSLHPILLSFHPTPLPLLHPSPFPFLPHPSPLSLA